MFNKVPNKSAIPERVFELCNIVKDKPQQNDDLKNKIEPDYMEITNYYNHIKNVAIELNLIKQNENKDIEYIQDKSYLKNMYNLRKYCNSLLFSQDNINSQFFKITNCYLNTNEYWLTHTLGRGNDTFNFVRKQINDTTLKDDSDELLAIRFWLSFLGFGYIHEFSNSIYLLPNMYIALKDFISLSNFQKGKEYTVSEFFETIEKVSVVGFINDGFTSYSRDIFSSKTINFAMSNALRQLHDNKEIEIIRNLDSKEIWYLYKNEYHVIEKEITHIIYKGIK